MGLRGVAVVVRRILGLAKRHESQCRQSWHGSPRIPSYPSFAMPSWLPTFFFALERMGITTSETHARTIPGILCSGGFLPRRTETASQVTYTARAMKQVPTILILNRSFLSRLSSSASTDILHSSVAPEVTSMKLSIPKPTSEMLPAITPAMTATNPSRLFQPIVKYSSRLPRSTTVLRVAANSVTARAYQYWGGLRCRTALLCQSQLTCGR
jgi:hypothetical protein